MFRELARTAVASDRAHSNGTGPLFSLDGVPLRAALLDADGAPEHEDAAEADDGAAGRHVLAARTAAAALADVADSGRAAPSRTGVIIAESAEPGTPAAGRWVRDSLGLSGVTSALSADWDLGGSGDLARPGLDTSCSLAAIAAGCEVLNTGELDLVLAGGVSTGIDHAWLSHRGRAGQLATGDLRIYDTNPTGTLPGEGCGVVALMRAADARAAGLPVYAEIAGWHAATGTDPDPAALWPAYLRSGIDPADVQFLEGHGAATAAEDLAELSALAEVLGPHVTGAGGRCALGAVTANIGDTRSAAGVAALLKTALAMVAGIIPATTGCVRPHRLLRTHTSPFRLPPVPEPWPQTPVQIAAVNSLGVAGPQGLPGSGPVHVVLRREQETGHRPGRRRRAASTACEVVQLVIPAPRSGDTATPRAGTHAAPPSPRQPQDSHSPAAEPTPDVEEREEGGGEAVAVQAMPADADARQQPGRETVAVQAMPADADAKQQPGGETVAVQAMPADADARQQPGRETVAVQQVRVSADARQPGQERPAGAVEVVGEAEAKTVVAVRGDDREDLAITLDTIAITAARLTIAQLRPFARELAAASHAGQGEVRAAILAADPVQLAARATWAAALLRTAGAGALRVWPEPDDQWLAPPADENSEAVAAPGGPGVYLTERAGGRVVLLFPGLADAASGHTATLAASLATVTAAERLGVTARAGVGYSLGEITGLAWAGIISFGEAARLAVCYAEILRAAPRQTAMARVLAGPAMAGRLRAGTSLVLAADEGPAQQVVAGPAAELRDLSGRAADLGVTVEVLDVPCAVHSPAAQPYLAAWRAVIGGQRFDQPRRRLISTVTGLDVLVSGDIQRLLAAQLTRPALLAGALALACADADLVLLAAPDPALAAAAAACGRTPVFGSPVEHHGTPTPAALAAFFAAGAIDTVAAVTGDAADSGQAAAPVEAVDSPEVEPDGPLGPTARSGYAVSPSRSQAETPARA